METTPALRLRTVVAAVDFSPGSAAALARAADLAERSGAALHVLHADVLFRSSGDAAPDASPSSALRVRVERFAALALGLDGPSELDALAPTIAVVRDATPRAAILRYAADAYADLVVVGTHGRSGVARVLLGSVAEALVASAPCPVLTVPASDAAPPAAPVLVAVDFSERSRAALAAGAALAALYGAPLELVHAVRDAGPYPPFAPEILSVSDRDPDQDAAVRERLARFAGDTAVAAVHVAYGAPSRAVPTLAAEIEAGVVVMGTHARAGVARIVGSVAEATLRRAPCAVLTLREAERLGSLRAPVRSALA